MGLKGYSSRRNGEKLAIEDGKAREKWRGQERKCDYLHSPCLDIDLANESFGFGLCSVRATSD